MNSRSKVTILGATGSIGISTLDVIRRHPDRFTVFAVSGHRQLDSLFDQCVEFNPEFAVVSSKRDAGMLASRLRKHGVDSGVLHGEDGLSRIASHQGVDIVVTGIVGAAGLLPTIAAVKAAKRILVANKEPLVMMGRTMVEMASAAGAVIIPLDSEHNAIFQCLPDTYRVGDSGAMPGVRRILLTASGGPFRATPIEQLERVTPTQAIAHPNWSMGPKISVDSATLMNKGLELIEACALFSLKPSDVQVVIHPQSTIHSMVEYLDGSVLAQMGAPDMRIPIAHGLGWPDRIESGAASLDLFQLGSLEFEAPDEGRFPCLRLAREAAESGGTAPAVLNAANEIAVEAFLDEKLAFRQIPQVIEHTLEHIPMENDQSLSNVLRVDSIAREHARASICSLTRPFMGEVR